MNKQDVSADEFGYAQDRWLVSDLLDNQLPREEFSRAMQVLDQSEESRTTWLTYHCLGDVMRQGEQAMKGTGTVDFVTRLQARLLLEDKPVELQSALQIEANYPISKTVSSSNDASFSWRRIAAVACLMAVTVLTWSLMQPSNTSSGQAQLAQVPISPFVSESEQQVMIRDPRLDQLLAEHRQHGGASALQMPSGFLRSATFDKTAR
jgi:sigma-E factor negative regulatory protein RseA